MKALIVISLIAILLALSWAISVGLIYLICLCFSWEFSLLTATVIYLIGCLIYSFLPKGGAK